jgi:bifunctional DNase/RNase
VAESVPIYVAEQVLDQTEADASADFDLESDDELDFE